MYLWAIPWFPSAVVEMQLRDEVTLFNFDLDVSGEVSNGKGKVPQTHYL
jgi:hypothetical protein